jgi:hypothetical protein
MSFFSIILTKSLFWKSVLSFPKQPSYIYFVSEQLLLVDCRDDIMIKLIIIAALLWCEQAENMIAHRDEIYSRPKKTWFLKEKEKKLVAKEAKVIFNFIFFFFFFSEVCNFSTKSICASLPIH